MTNFASFHGTVTMINNLRVGGNGEGCYQLMSVENEQGAIVNFIVSPTTYFVNHEIVAVGDRITGYYDTNTPVPLIYPPQYQALIIVKENPHHFVKVD